MKMKLLICLGICWSSMILAEDALQAQETARPNIIFILADDLGYGDVQCLNPANGKIATPSIDRLASQGMVFTDAHTTSSVCTPTRYSILTGRYNWRTHLQKGVLFGFSKPLIAKDRLTVAGFLKSNGYATGAIGKWHLGMDMPFTDETHSNNDDIRNIDWKKPIENGPVDRGFDYFFGISASLDMTPYIYIENDRFVGEATATKTFLRKGPAEPDFEAIDVLPMIGKKTIEFIEKQDASTPFFAYVAFASPHTPILPSKEWQGKSELGAYGDFVMQTDAVVGNIVDAIDRSGFGDNTLIIVTSDNGCSKAADIDALESKGHFPSANLRGSKADLWDGGHRVPFIVRWPDAIKPGSSTDQPICQVDLLATCAELIDAPIPTGAGEDSVSFKPALLGQQISSTRAGLIHHSINGHFAYRQGKWKLLLAKGSGGWTSPRENEVDANTPIAQLYDMESDPGETNNLIRSRPEIARRLLKQMTSDVKRGRSTDGPVAANDAQNIVIWKGKDDANPNQKITYKTVDGVELKLHVFNPPHHSATNRSPAIVLFFGGGWKSGSPNQFYPQCAYFASKGMVAMAAEYRTQNQHQTTPAECVKDGKSAIRYIREHADELGIDPQKLVAGGGSAGGHIAAAAGTGTAIDENTVNTEISSRPNALVLFNPVFDNGPEGYGYDRVESSWQQISPLHNIDAQTPPTIVFLGTKDKLIPVATAEKYKARMEAVGVQCELRLFEDRGHGFFNYQEIADSDDPFQTTVEDSIEFLSSLGILKG